MGFTKKVTKIWAVDGCGIPLSLINLLTYHCPNSSNNHIVIGGLRVQKVANLYSTCGISVGAEASFCFVYPKTITRLVVVSKHTTYSSNYICCHGIN